MLIYTHAGFFSNPIDSNLLPVCLLHSCKDSADLNLQLADVV